jgi:ABC-type multidrug transport system fused ATPase/permease subunit
VLVVQGGRIGQSGTHEQLSRQQGLYRSLHQARFGRQRGPRPLVLSREDA